MQEKSTIKSGYILSSVIFLVFSMALFLTGFTATSQTYCANETIIWSENFGNGTTATTLPNVINLGFQPTGSLNDGYYRIVNNTHQRPEWHNTVNHTPTGIKWKWSTFLHPYFNQCFQWICSRILFCQFIFNKCKHAWYLRP